MSEQLIRDRLLEEARRREDDREKRIQSLSEDNAVHKTLYKHATAKPEDIEVSEAKQEAKLNEAIRDLKETLREDRKQWFQDMSKAIDESESKTRAAIADQHKRWLSRAVVVVAVVVSLLIGGVEMGIKTVAGMNGWVLP